MVWDMQDLNREDVKISPDLKQQVKCGQVESYFK